MKNDAPSFCDRAAELMRERGKQYDKPEGERSMARTVAAFNAVTGRDLSEPEGWLLMLLLKQVRQWQQPDQYHADSAEDAVAYSALLAEALAAQTGGEPATNELLPLLPIVVGGEYRRRDGSRATIVVDDGTSVPFKANDGFWYLHDGRVHGAGCKPNKLDLVERIA